MVSKIVFLLLSLFCLPCYASWSANELTIQEKVGQMLMVHFHGEEANEEAKIVVQDLHIGAVIYYEWANGLTSPQQVLRLSAGLQELAKQNPHPIPLLISTDQEGGKVARLAKGFTVFPGNHALGMTKDPKWARLCAFVMGEELLNVGVNMNLAPVVDVNSNPQNPIIGVRSFGNSTDIVIPFGMNAMEGYNKAGVITCLKHFPGHGDVGVDSHLDLPVLKKTKQQLDQMELLPFSKLAKKADTIMTAHIMVPVLDPINCATLSKPILDILRNEMHFDGVIVSDSMVMEGLLKNCSSLDDAVIRAIHAGCDLVCLGGKQIKGESAGKELTVQDLKRIHQAIVQAVQDGRISLEDIDRSVQRVLDLKESYHLTDWKPIKEAELDLLVDTEEHRALAKQITLIAFPERN